MRDEDPPHEDARLVTERLATAIRASGVVVFSQDAELRYTWIHNPGFGFTTGEVLGRRDAELLERPGDAAVLDAVKQTVLRTGVAQRQEVALHHGGAERWYDLAVEPQRDAAGVVVGVTCVAVDITRYKRHEAALTAAHDTFHHLVEHSPFGIYVVNADFRLVQVSAGAQKVFAQVRPLLGRDFAEVLRQLWPEPFASDAIAIFRRTLDTGEPFHAPATTERRNDIDAVESYDWKTERLTLPDGRVGVVCHFYDLSERQRYEAALRDADREKDEFLAMLAHELRNPLAPIRTAAGVLRLIAPDSPAIASCRDTIERQTAQMARLLDDLLDVSRLTGGRLVLDRAPVLVDEVLAAAVETSRPAIEGQQQRLGISGVTGLVVHGDSVRLTQVFANLLNNAAKFSPAGSAISVEVRAEAGRAVVTVRDQGIGIAPEWRERVFELFAREPGADGLDAGGLGIGLSLARRLVELHDGVITVTSNGRDAGSAFVVSLPELQADHRRHDDVVRSTGAVRVAAPRVLVVDDNQDSADVTALLLEAQGCDARAVYDGAAALALAETFRPRFVLLDLGLPGLDGFELCRRVRAAPWAADVTAIAISGWARPQDRERSRDAGFDHHLMKPVAPEALVQLIHDVLTAS